MESNKGESGCISVMFSTQTALCIMANIIGNRIGNSSSNHEQDCLSFTSLLCPRERHESITPHPPAIIKQTGFFSLRKSISKREGKLYSNKIYLA